jgi:hypothetical protein
MPPKRAKRARAVGPKPPYELTLEFHGRVLEHLGIQMYQKPVNALAELVANTWDADSPSAEITLPKKLESGATITVRDRGLGMTFDECQQHFLKVGRNRRAKDPDARSTGGRRILGRKGIGKFAGFGIAKIITIDTTSKETGEHTVFVLRLDDLLTSDYVDTSSRRIDVVEYEAPSRARRASHGTTVTLSHLTLNQLRGPVEQAKSMARRFQLQAESGFKITVNGQQAPDDLASASVQFRFPEAYKSDEKPDGLTIDKDGWGAEKLANGRSIRWRFLFFKDPIEEEELRGVAVFSGVKVAQAPFNFQMTQGTTAQHGLEYLAGRVIADYIDELPEDLISTERQRINWEHDETRPLLEWGEKRLRQVLRIWAERRAEKREKELDEKVAEFSARLAKLSLGERATIRRALRQIAKIPTLSDAQFQNLGGAILSAWEGGRVKALVEAIAQAAELSSDSLLSLLLEVDVISAINTAEAILTKLETVYGLRVRIARRELENDLRDFIADHPWLVSPEWETYRKERNLGSLLKDAAKASGWDKYAYQGRVDLTLSSGKQLLVIEFMRPGESLDDDHLHRFSLYVRALRRAVESQTNGRFDQVTGYLVADKLDKNPLLREEIIARADDGMLAMDWTTLLTNSIEQHRHLLESLAQRAPTDERMLTLVDELDAVMARYGKAVDLKAKPKPKKK